MLCYYIYTIILGSRTRSITFGLNKQSKKLWLCPCAVDIEKADRPSLSRIIDLLDLDIKRTDRATNQAWYCCSAGPSPVRRPSWPRYKNNQTFSGTKRRTYCSSVGGISRTCFCQQKILNGQGLSAVTPPVYRIINCSI